MFAITKRTCNDVSSQRSPAVSGQSHSIRFVFWSMTEWHGGICWKAPRVEPSLNTRRGAGTEPNKETNWKAYLCHRLVIRSA